MSVGSDLKSARESKKIPLETISLKTKIPVKYLEALEEDNYGVFPSQTYAKGFIRAYCKVVGLDANKMTKEFKNQVPEVLVKIEPMNAEAEMEKNSPFLGARPAVIRQSDAGLEAATDETEDDLPDLHEPLRHHTAPSRRRVKWRSFYSGVGQLVMGLIFLGAIWLGWQKLSPLVGKFHLPSTTSASAPTPVSASASTSTSMPASVTAAPEEEPAPQLLTAGVQDKFQHLILKGLDKSWILVTLDDGKTSSEIDLAQGDVRSYRAVKNFKLRIGNAGGVDIQLNGKPLGVLGTTGEVVEITLPADPTDPSAAANGGT
jgi:cytoskeletal protein RodZ